MSRRSITVEILGDSASLERSFKRASNSASRFDRDLGRSTRGALAGSGAFRGLGRSIAFASGGFLAGFGATSALRAAFEEFSQSQKVAAQTSAVLKSTGGVAGVSAKKVDRLAKSIEHLTAFDDEAVKAGENVLLSFTRIHDGATKQTQIFDRTTRAVIDYAARTGVDVPQAAKLFGRALNDPIKGLTRLTRVGIDFTAAEKKQITQLEKSGHIQEAQAIILGKLEQRYKGAAVAAGDTFSGNISKLENSLLDMAGTIVGLVTPSIEKWLTKINAWLSKGENQKRVIDDISSAGRTLKSVIDTVVAVMEPLVRGANRVAHALGGWDDVFKVALAAWVFTRLATLSGSIGGVGRQARGAKGEVGGLRKSLLGLNGLRVVATIAVVEQIFSMFSGKNTAPKGTPGHGHTKRFDAAHDINPKTGKRGALGSAEHAISKGVHAATHPHIPHPHIPHLAGGGVVRTPTLAMIGERGPEAVVPLGRSGFAGVTITGPVYLQGVQDPVSFMRELQKLAGRSHPERRGRFAGVGSGF